MFYNYKTFVLSAITLLSLTSCATIVKGTRQSVGISSCPSNASVFVDRNFVGSTPLIVEMTREDNHFVRIELEGYQPYEVVFSRKFNSWALGNVLFGGFIGLAVDAVTGAIYTLTPDQVQAELQSGNIAHSKKSKDSYIAVVLQPKPEWRQIGKLAATSNSF